jgi:Protein of unknown function (DUF1393).
MSNIHSKAFVSRLSDLKKPKQLSICGLLIALYVVTSFANIPISQLIQIRFGFLVLAVAGFIGGPIMGATVGVFGDLLSVFVTGQAGNIFLGFTLSYCLLGILFGLIFHNAKITITRCILATLVDFIISFVLNTAWLSILYGSPYKALLITRLPKCLIMLFINGVMLYAFLKSLSMVIKKSSILA